jgi:16S rRNA (uracil1498-N3)-methyltransferase
VEITLIQGLIRKEKWEFFLQKATEVGVHRIVPLILERNVVKWDRTDEAAKMKRYHKIVQEAAEQSRRSDIPLIELPINIHELPKYMSELNFVAYENESELSLKHALKPASSVTVVMGSEGGISPEEIAVMSSMGFKPVTLGTRILRAETAGIVVCTTIENILD